jgi:hypothetical protein
MESVNYVFRILTLCVLKKLEIIKSQSMESNNVIMVHRYCAHVMVSSVENSWLYSYSH